MALVDIHNLSKYFYTGRFRKRAVKAVDGVSLELHKGETLGLVGESGCGKTTIARCVTRLIKPTSGEIFFMGRNFAAVKRNLKTFRKDMQIIFQDADGSLNPRMKSIDLLLEPLKVHTLLNGNAKETACELMEKVNLPADLMERFPHELSGGQRQRIGIARAISLNPRVIVADEAVASLDRLIQAQIIDLLKKIQAEQGVSYLYITHNLDVLRQMANTVAVMYLGKIVEKGDVKTVFNHPSHPYTRAMMVTLPGSDLLADTMDIVLKGEIPSPLNPPSGCAFHTRCPDVKAVCREYEPVLMNLGNDHSVACHLATA